MVRLAMLVPPSLGTARSKARAELLESALAGELGVEVSVRVARDYGELQRDVVSASVELAWAPAAVLANLDEARVLLRAVRGGRALYRSALVARADAGLSLATLTSRARPSSGRRAAWVDPLSAGGYLLPLSLLRGHGIEPNLVFDEQLFLGSHRAVVDAVLEGDADVCAVSTPSRDAAELARVLAFYAGTAADKLVVLGVSEPVPTDAIVVTTKVDPELAERIAKKLLPGPKGRTPSFLLTAMEAERLERTEVTEYRAVRALISGRRTMRPKAET